MLYSGDPRFWLQYDSTSFLGLKVVGCRDDEGGSRIPDDFPAEFENVQSWLPKCSRLHLSGSQAIVYAAWWGARRIILTGMDMRGGHWHADHNNRPPDYVRHAAGLEALAPELAAMGIEVINATRDTALTCFPRMGLEEALEQNLEQLSGSRVADCSHGCSEVREHVGKEGHPDQVRASR